MDFEGGNLLNKTACPLYLGRVLRIQFGSGHKQALNGKMYFDMQFEKITNTENTNFT